MSLRDTNSTQSTGDDLRELRQRSEDYVRALETMEIPAVLTSSTIEHIQLAVHAIGVVGMKVSTSF